MPEVGETYLGFRLVQELGRGSFARVFLAEQEALAGRQVALKVTLRPTREPERLAKLQHPNIVPVYSVHPAPPAQVICMPFRGLRTLADLLVRTRPSAAGPVRRTHGTRNGGSSTILGARVGSSGQPPSGTHQRPAVAGSPPDADDELVGNPDAVLTVLRQLADGLAHAHARGILHLDLKPANVLIADSGEPMLLDFNLSYDTTAGDRDLVGGTIPYMAPEQIVDLRSRGNGDVDVRTDLYGLGAVTFELLTGTVPFVTASRSTRDYDTLLAARKAGPPRVRDKNPAVSPAVEAIVRKLLAPNPADRYQSADQLTEDIDRHLADRPLRRAPNTSVLERAGKWRRRNPKTPGRLIAAVLLGVAIGTGVVAYQKSQAHIVAVAETKARNARAAADTVRLDLAVPGQPGQRMRGIARGTALLTGYGLPDDPAWMQRDDFRRLTPDERVALSADLGELLLLVAHAKWQDARSRSEEERKASAEDGLRLIRAAGWCFPADEAPPFLARLEAEYAAAIAGGPPAVIRAEPVTARDHFLEAVGLVADGRYAGAVSHLKTVVSRRPEDGPAQFCLALCLQRLGEVDKSAERYEVAQAILPTDPRPALSRGLILTLKSKLADAEAEFTRALALDPADPDPYLHRGRVRGRLGRHAEAAADFTAALDRGGPALQLRLLRADSRRQLKDDAGAKSDLEAAAACRPVSELDYLVRAAQLVRKDPQAALADYRAAAALNPRSLPALQNQAHVLADKLGADEDAIVISAKAAAYYPQFAPARVGHAVLLARLGRRDEAHAEAGQALVLSEDPSVLYQVGCVYALTARTHPGDAGKALDLIRKAYRGGYSNVRQLDHDTDLKALRAMPEFGALAASVRELFREI
jgi:serine/threonine protein kinase/Flp pilus assembly protein TadD